MTTISKEIIIAIENHSYLQKVNLYMNFKNILKPVVLALSLGAASVQAADVVNIYTTREPGLLKPILEAFEKDTGIKAETVFVKDGLAERVESEGDKSPADVLMVVDISQLTNLVERGLTQPTDSKVLTEVIPEQYRDPNNHWFALSLRYRVLYARKDMPLDSFNYEDLADPKYKGRVCIRSGKHPYNATLFGAMIAHNGVEETEAFLKGVKANLARKATGGDRNVARDILGGICDLGFANSYYVGKMYADPKQKEWTEAIKVIKPTFKKTGGTHANISGAAVAKYAPNKDNAVKLLEYLVGPTAQEMYAKVNYEHPIRAGVAPDPIIAEFGEFKADTLPLIEVPKHRKTATEIVEKIGFDD